MQKTRLALAVAFLPALLAVSGCGDETKGEVNGTVKVDGELVAAGTIAFFPEDGKGQPAGGTIKDGHYAVRNVPVGAARVAIKNPKAAGKKAPSSEAQGPQRMRMEETLPPKYSDFARTELRYEVKSGTNEKDFDLRTK